MDMRVANAYNAQSVYGATSSAGTRKAERLGRADGKSDTFTLSGQAGDFQLARKALAGTPDVRDEVVNRLKSKIEAGQYDIDTSDIANKMLAAVGA